MGALEYEPAQELVSVQDSVDIDALTKLASDILTEKNFHIEKNDSMMAQLSESNYERIKRELQK